LAIFPLADLCIGIHRLTMPSQSFTYDRHHLTLGLTRHLHW